ncbi:MAG TPA: RNA polymerase subunit sigma-24 [Deltaproteobacteria bacterium]|nr:RNA polymerase subunit sigma-24 [Deltaproteobacteria bacterium]
MAVTSNNLEAGYREKDEDEVILACQNGDVRAYEFLVNRYQKQMFNIAFRMTGSYEEACEVVQEVFLAAYRSIKKYRREARFSTWLYSITVNQTRTRLREMRSHDFHEGVSIDDPPEDDKDSVLRRYPSHQRGVVEEVEQKEIKEKVQECINALDDEHREVVVLRDIQGFSYDEIAEMLKVPDGTVKSRLFRARLMLKDSIGKVLGL